MIPYKHTCTSDILLCLFLYIPVVWFALVLAQSFGEGGLPVLLQNLTAVLNNPLDIRWTENSPTALLFATGIYGLCMGLYFTDRAKRRDGEEHGSAAWGSPQQVNAMFAQRQNKPLTRHVKLGLDARKHKRNLNVLVIGGSGASKTRGYVKPNILEANTNYVITDPKQEVLTATGGFLRKQGYDVRVLNLVNLEQSDGYNPFVYLRDDKVAMVMRKLEFAEVSEEDEEHISPLDMLFRALEQEQPNHIAVRQYRIFKQAAGKTAKSILVAAAVRLAAFNLPQIAKITSHDDMDLYSLGEKKRALYAVIPDNDNTFHFLVSILYAQAFQTLYYSADQIYHGALPCHVHFILDEFAAMPLPGYTRELATMRSRNISSSTIIQNIAQIKELYKDSWETILGNSDTILYLGGNESSTHKLISEMLGKSSILTQSHGKSHGKSGNYSTNTQSSGRELLTPDEVRMLDNRYCILFIRGTPPVMDRKIDLTKHRNVRFTPDGGGPGYFHTNPIYQGEPLFRPRSRQQENHL